ncbi:UbiA prenyltransferase family protein [Kitasatospora sp. NBC_01539]|uniref:UbiA prenyltransferase family protein n=1 Tax=Kitasatospora sp. NBC_01539 TaxID=2903577 RepID=UPI0038600B5A
MIPNPLVSESTSPPAPSPLPVPPPARSELPPPPSGPDTSSRRPHPRDVIALLRPGQWAKNVYSMALVGATASVWTVHAAWQLLWITVVFVIASGAVYIGNDVADRDNDRRHPVKRNRPLASGRVGMPTAIALLAVCLGVLTALLATSPPTRWWPVVAYLGLNIGYSAGLKHVPLVDAFIVAIGFQLRLVAGYLAVGEDPSQWLLTAVLAVCLVLVLGKRRHELITDGRESRPALRGYTAQLIDQMLVICMVVTILSTLLYLWRDAPLGQFSTHAVLISAPFTLFGLFRYLQVLVVERGGADPVRILLRDRTLLICMAAFALAFLTALYAAHHSLPASTATSLT